MKRSDDRKPMATLHKARGRFGNQGRCTRRLYSIFKFQAESSMDFIQLESYMGRIDEKIESAHEAKLRHSVYLL